MSKTRHHDQFSVPTPRGTKGAEFEGTCPLCNAPGSTCIHCLTCGNSVCACSDEDDWCYRGASKTSARALDRQRLTRLIDKLSTGWVDMTDEEVWLIANTILTITSHRVTSHPTISSCEGGHKHDYLLHLEQVWGQLRAGRAAWADLWVAAHDVSVFYDPRDGEEEVLPEFPYDEV